MPSSPNSTFGLPSTGRPQAETFAAIDAWRRENIAAGRASSSSPMRSARRSACLGIRFPTLRLIVCYGAVEAINALSRGRNRPPPTPATQIETSRFRPRPAFSPRRPPPQAHGSSASGLFRRVGERPDAGQGKPPEAGARPRLCAFRPRRLARPHRRHQGDRGGARLVTHGYTEPLIRYLREQGFDARALKTAYGDDEDTGGVEAPAEGEGGAGGGRSMKAFAALYRNSIGDLDPRQAGGDGRVLRRRKADQCDGRAPRGRFISSAAASRARPRRPGFSGALPSKALAIPTGSAASATARSAIFEMLSLILPEGAAARTFARSMGCASGCRRFPRSTRSSATQGSNNGSANRHRRASRLFKLITGELRVGVSRLQAVKALAEVAGVDEGRMAQRLIGYSQARRIPTAADFEALIGKLATEAHALDAGKPYPFYLAQSWSCPVPEMARAWDAVGLDVEWKLTASARNCQARRGLAVLVARPRADLRRLSGFETRARASGDRDRRRACRLIPPGGPVRDGPRSTGLRFSRACSSGSGENRREKTMPNCRSPSSPLT